MNQNVLWKSQSTSSEDSMPLGGCGIGLNVWVEKGDILIYYQQSGAFDEHNAFLKHGRIRISSANKSWQNLNNFTQELNTEKAEINISFTDNNNITYDCNIWVNTIKPVYHATINSTENIKLKVSYESWRYEDRISPKEDTAIFGERNDIFGMWKYPQDLIRHKDNMKFNDKDNLIWYHKNDNSDLSFDKEMDLSGFKALKENLFNPLKNLTFGGIIITDNMKQSAITKGSYLGTPFQAYNMDTITPSKVHNIDVFCYLDKIETIEEWEDNLNKMVVSYKNSDLASERKNTQAWWDQYWNRSWIEINPNTHDNTVNTQVKQVSRNYKLFRFMQGFNNNGQYPLKFNGGLHTYDSVLVKSVEEHRSIDYINEREQARRDRLAKDSHEVAASENLNLIRDFGPDYRAWGGGSLTLQNQRLLYWPLLKSGDTDLCKVQFDWFMKCLETAERRSIVAYGHTGCSFAEQITSYGIPIGSHFGWDRDPADGLGLGDQVSLSCSAHYSTQLEFAYMILQAFEYTQEDVKEYLPFIHKATEFFFNHYEYQAMKYNRKAYDENNKLIIFPSTALESYKDAKNPNDVICGLRAVYTSLLKLHTLSSEEKSHYQARLDKVPTVTTRIYNGHEVISPAEEWSEMNNVELPQMYPVYPYEEFGVGKPKLQLARHTWEYSCDEMFGQRSYASWHQDGIFCAHLGLIAEANQTLICKLADSGRRFPAFWGPGHDWTPDFNWGATGLMQLQEMLLQTKDGRLLLFPCWAKDWDVDFKLHAPQQTIIQCTLKKGEIVKLKVTPTSRHKDIEILL